MRKLSIYVALLALCGAISGCLDDKNDFNYSKQNELDYSYDNFNDLKDFYDVAVGVPLVLKPTFKFTIDKENPDVSYEWHLDGKLLTDERGASYTFISSKSGAFEITFSVVDNKSGVKFSKSTRVQVMSEYQRGWVILSKGEDGRSILHFIIPSLMSYATTYDGEELIRDSILYHKVKLDVNPGLGKNPVRLVENMGHVDYNDDMGIKVYDELLVVQDNWEELNGGTLEHEVYTYEEFRKDLPVDYSPQESVMTYSAKAILDKNGNIYWNVKGDAADFHAGFYTSIPLNNGMKFSRLFQNLKFWNRYSGILALTREDKTIVGIMDSGDTKNNGTTAITENSSKRSGNVYSIIEPDGTNHFKNIDKDVIDLYPATCSAANGYDITSAYPSWVALMKEPGTSSYELRYFELMIETGRNPSMTLSQYDEKSLGTISNFKDMAVFNNKLYVVIADGRDLWYCQYGRDPETGTPYTGSKIKIATLPADVVSLSANDVQVNAWIMPYDYGGQLGVALSDGSFYIYNVNEKKDSETGLCDNVTLNQVFPNEKVTDNKFGNIVDVLYKIGRGTHYLMYAF